MSGDVASANVIAVEQFVNTESYHSEGRLDCKADFLYGWNGSALGGKYHSKISFLGGQKQHLTSRPLKITTLYWSGIIPNETTSWNWHSSITLHAPVISKGMWNIIHLFASSGLYIVFSVTISCLNSKLSYILTAKEKSVFSPSRKCLLTFYLNYSLKNIQLLPSTTSHIQSMDQDVISMFKVYTVSSHYLCTTII